MQCALQFWRAQGYARLCLPALPLSQSHGEWYDPSQLCLHKKKVRELKRLDQPEDVDISLDDADDDDEAEQPGNSRDRPFVQRSVTFDEGPNGASMNSKNPSGLGRIRTTVTRQNSRDDSRSDRAASSIMQNANVSSTRLEDLEAFPTTSLHSFSFAAQHDTIAARHNIVQRSIEYLRQKLSNGARSVSFQTDSDVVMKEDEHTGRRMPLRLDLSGVNDHAFDPSRQPLRTAPAFHFNISPDDSAHHSAATSQQSSGRTSPNPISRSTTTTSHTSIQSQYPQSIRGRASSFSEKYPELRKQLQSSLSCTNLPSLNPYYQVSPLQPAHNPNRWNQQSTQAVFTTSLEEPWNIQSANDYALMIFGMGKDAIRRKSLVDYVVEDRRSWLKTRLTESQQNKLADGRVLLCGDVLPVIKRLGIGAASLWIKEKTNGLVWVIEEIEEGVCILSLDPTDQIITAAHGDASNVFEKDAVDQRIDAALTTLPRLPGGLLDLEQISQVANYTLNSAAGIIPCTVEPSIFSTEDKHSLRVSYLPHVAGIIVLGADTLTVKSANTVFTSSLFGLKSTAGLHINQLVPNFERLLEILRERNEGEFSEGQVIAEMSFREAAKSLVDTTPETVLRGIEIRHRDGASVFVDIQMRISAATQPLLPSTSPRTTTFSLASNETDEHLYALWISFEQGLTPKAQHEVVHTAMTNVKKIVAPSNVSEPPSPVDKMSEDELALSVSEIVPRDIKDYTILEEMGAGAYGQVKLARYGRKRQRIVLKYVTKSRILVDTWTRDRKLGTVPLEIHVLNHLKSHQHRNLVDMLDFFEDDQNYYIVMSAHVPGMDLFDYIELNTSMSEWECKCISLQVAKALEHLHSLDIVHRDIKDENVVLDRNGWVKLIDFGSANYCKNGPFDTFHGTLDYASPEALDGKPYMGKEQDVWACGILFYTLIYKENPFYNIDEIMDRDLRVPYIISEKSIDLIRKMLNRDVPARLTMAQVLEHEWYADCEGEPQERVRIDIPPR